MPVRNSDSDLPALEARHFKAIDLLATGLTPAAVARELKVCDRTLRRPLPENGRQSTGPPV